jgi:hypothetical protein
MPDLQSFTKGKSRHGGGTARENEVANCSRCRFEHLCFNRRSDRAVPGLVTDKRVRPRKHVAH